MTFRALCGDSPDTLTIVARFLALLELFREGAVAFEQVTPLGELTVRWTGADEGEVEIDEFDEFDRRPAPERRTEERRRRTPPRSPSRRPESDQPTSTTEPDRVTDEARPSTCRSPALRPVAGGGADGRRRAAGRRSPWPPRSGYPVGEVDRRRWPTLADGVRPSRAAASSCATSAGGWRFYTREEYAAVVERFVLDGQQARLTQAALETLAVVAYRQPVSRARVSAVRGVNVDGVMRTLLTRGLVEEAGHDARDRRHPLPHDRLLPGADRRHLARRPARARAVPARTWTTSRTSSTLGRRPSRTRRRHRALGD